MAAAETNTNTSSEYRSIFKSTSFFGVVMIFSILISIIPSKIVDLLIAVCVALTVLFTTVWMKICYRLLADCHLSVDFAHWVGKTYGTAFIIKTRIKK